MFLYPLFLPDHPDSSYIHIFPLDSPSTRLGCSCPRTLLEKPSGSSAAVPFKCRSIISAFFPTVLFHGKNLKWREKKDYQKPTESFDRGGEALKATER